MSESNAALSKRLVVGHKCDGRRVYDNDAKRELIEACLRPGVSVARMALQHGVNANLLRTWITRYRREDDKTVDQPPPPAPNAFYPEPRYVVTQFARELSWMFEALRDIFFDAELIDGATKIEFFGRLANASQRKIQETGVSLRSEILLGAALHEAYRILEESSMESFQDQCELHHYSTTS